MHSPSGVELAGLASLLVAVPAVALLADSGRRHTGAARRAHLLLAAGAAVTTAAALAGLLSDLFLAQRPAQLGSAVAVAMALGTCTLLAGTLVLPGAAENAGAAWRHLLDGCVNCGRSLAAEVASPGWQPPSPCSWHVS